MVLNPEAFPHVSLNDVLEISPNAALEGAGEGVGAAEEVGAAAQRERERRKKSLFLQVCWIELVGHYYRVGLQRLSSVSVSLPTCHLADPGRISIICRRKWDIYTYIVSPGV
jgi:hypothetical protein